jgi:hypothetical protein
MSPPHDSSCCQGTTSVSLNRMSAAALAALTDNDATELERILGEYFLGRGMGAPGPGERRSWRNSLPAFARDLRDAGLGQVEVILEHRLPLTSKRADVVVAGVHPKTGAASYLVVELKQWGTAHRWEGSETLVDVDGARYRPSLHPSLQVAGYVDYMRDFVAVLADRPAAIAGVAYLHNATDHGVGELRDKDPDFRNRVSVDDATFDRLVRHVCKVLLTRGMIGTLVYSEDEETRLTTGPAPLTWTENPMRPLGAAARGKAREKSVAMSPGSTGSGRSEGRVGPAASDAKDSRNAPLVAVCSRTASG